MSSFLSTWYRTIDRCLSVFPAANTVLDWIALFVDMSKNDLIGWDDAEERFFFLLDWRAVNQVDGWMDAFPRYDMIWFDRFVFIVCLLTILRWWTVIKQQAIPSFPVLCSTERLTVDNSVRNSLFDRRRWWWWMPFGRSRSAMSSSWAMPLTNWNRDGRLYCMCWHRGCIVVARFTGHTFIHSQ